MQFVTVVVFSVMQFVIVSHAIRNSKCLFSHAIRNSSELKYFIIYLFTVTYKINDVKKQSYQLIIINNLSIDSFLTKTNSNLWITLVDMVTTVSCTAINNNINNKISLVKIGGYCPISIIFKLCVSILWV
jgi:hypothetical protein